MNHLEVEKLASEYLERALEPALAAQFDAHLAGCAHCRELVADLRQTLELCRTAEDLEPPSWLVSKILLATTGQRKPSLREQVIALFRPVAQPRIAYALGMAVFSISIIVNAAGINLRRLRAEDLNPRTWLYRANRTGHLLYARAEKFCYDLRVVYELESRLRQLRQESVEQRKEAPKPESPPGGATNRNQPTSPRLASIWLDITWEPFLAGGATWVQSTRSTKQ